MTEIKLLNKIGKAGVDRFDGAKYTLSEDAAAKRAYGFSDR